jgi:hypothetical protein
MREKPILEPEGLVMALESLDRQWFLSTVLKDPTLIEESLEGWRKENEKTVLTLKTRALFEGLHKRGVTFLPPPFPKMLMIMVNRADDLVPESEVREFLEELALPSALTIRVPLWDLEECRSCDPREMRGYLSEDYFELLKRYDAEYLVLIQRDSLRTLWDLRIVSKDREEISRSRQSSFEGVRKSLSDAMLYKYFLKKAPSHQTLCLPRGAKGTLLAGYKELENTAEVLYPLLRSADKVHVEYDLITHWSPDLLEFIAKTKSQELHKFRGY